MNVLVSAASWYGSTTEIAEAIGAALEAAGHAATVCPPGEVDSLDGFDAVVLGSGVYAGSWLKPAREFVKSHREELSKRPVWLFSSGPIGDPPLPKENAVKIEDTIAATGARDHRLFNGKLVKHGLRFADRAIVAALRAQEGDFRDWDAVRAWAHEISLALDTASAPR